MDTHPITDYPYRLVPVLIAALLLAIVQTVLLRGYAGADWLPAAIDGITTVGWFMALAYLAWFVIGIVSMPRTNLLTVIVGILLWLAGSFMVCDVMAKIAGVAYIPFAETIPFRLLFGIPAWIAVDLWYQLQLTADEAAEEAEFIATEKEALPALPSQEERIDRITVKDGSRIHIIKAEELLYIRACGDYATLITPSGEYIKEQTMKYLEAHLPAETFVRIHRSTIVNVLQISRVELFGKETYQVLLKNGVKLRVSLNGYRLLKERLGI